MPDNHGLVDCLVRAIPKQPQRQDSTQEQLNDLRLVAIHLGMYDALDHLQRLDLAMRLDLETTGL